MLYYMNSDTGNVIAREIGDEPFGNLWYEISEEEYQEALHPLTQKEKFVTALEKYIDDLVNNRDTEDDFPKNESSWEELFDLCKRLIAEIAALRRNVANVKDAEFMANIWLQYKYKFGEIVDDDGGDSDGVDFVALRILDECEAAQRAPSPAADAKRRSTE